MGIYVHVPFCRSKCAYCDFYSVPRTELTEDWLRCVGAEYAVRKDECGPEVPSTLYVGGGTPSVLMPEQVWRLMTECLPKVHPGGETTIEANPDDICGPEGNERVSAWMAAGVNRVSMGVQSMKDSELCEIGRRHDAATAVRAVETLRNAGVENIALDVIYGLPGQTPESWEYTLSRLLELHPEHFSAYILSYEPGTRLYARLLAGKVRETDDDVIARMYDILCRKAADAGYEHYEISNFALPGFRAVHNSSYWTGAPYLGLGPGAHSYDGRVRRVNDADLRAYIREIDAGRPFFTIDEEDDRDRLNDTIMTGLRTAEGLDLTRLSAEESAALLRRAEALPEGSVAVKNMRIAIPEERWLLSDAIIRELMA